MWHAHYSCFCLHFAFHIHWRFWLVEESIFKAMGCFWSSLNGSTSKSKKKFNSGSKNHRVNMPKSHHQRKILQRCFEDPEIPSQKTIRLETVCKRSDVGKLSCHKFKSGIGNLKVQNQNLISSRFVMLFQITFKRRRILRFNIGIPINRKIMIFANTFEFGAWSYIEYKCMLIVNELWFSIMINPDACFPDMSLFGSCFLIA